MHWEMPGSNRSKLLSQHNRSILTQGLGKTVKPITAESLEYEARCKTTASKCPTVSCCLHAFCKYLDAALWSHEMIWTNASLQC